IESSVPDALRALVLEHPDRVAVDAGPERVTYAELEHRASRVARAVLARHAGDGSPVALVVAHGVAPIVGTLGVLHAGRIPAPVDAREPADRLARIIGLTGASLVVTDAAHADLARAVAGGRLVLLLD